MITGKDSNNTPATFPLDINILASHVLPWTEVSQYFTVTGNQITGFASTGDYNLLKRCVNDGITEIQLGSATVTSIGPNVFRGSVSLSTNSCLKNVDASLISSIGTAAFYACPNLSFIKLGSTSIGDTAFNGCKNLTIPTSGVTITGSSIGSGAFRNCQELTYDMVANLTIATDVLPHIVHNGTKGVA
ncbi:hypothetical protein FACS1894166_12040 [Bacilli bacterium]|nr:hypothetical protein FACS1894166_12040 [Bacilli bacterium]